MLPDFDLVVGRSLDHVLGVLHDHPEATILAGGTDFVPFCRAGRWRPSLVVDVTRLAELREVREVGGGLEVGALATHASLARSPLVQAGAPLLAAAAASVAGPQVRARGTLGGNLCTASPAADTVPALLVLDAQVVLAGRGGQRCLPLAEFLLGPGKTARQPGELLTAVLLPDPPPQAGTVFRKVGKRQALVISVVNGAALVARDGRRVVEARLALGAVAPTVVRCPGAETLLAGQEPDENLWAEAARRVLETIRPIDDVRATAGYRQAAAVAISGRMLRQAYEGAHHESA